MRFNFKQASGRSERLGVLTGFVGTPNAVETPACAMLTQGGSVVHLTAEVLSKVFSNSRLLWVPLSNSLSLEAGVKAQGKGVAAFAGIPEHVTCVTLNNMNEITPMGHFEPDKVPLWTKQGKKLITADRYMDVMEIFKPDIIFADAVPKDLVRFVEGSWNPSVMMSAIECGWDVLDGSYAVKLTNAGQALVLNFDTSRSCDDSCVLDLIDESHNLHHFDQLFHHARLHIAADTFALYKTHITTQFDRYTPQMNGKAEQTNEIKVKESAVKKKRVSNSEHAMNGVIGRCFRVVKLCSPADLTTSNDYTI
ncbi:putative queuine tRNA-ribosyltransferase [Operophtera brumata]|uniref:Putative queuine tRNA-ribosyltransferase n=1 Tax=Operophtera brumata TaxID=104452 RepID=A0A0L7LI31_OPEBR|nr:putative queuine tRNA-ribosyltransferase [Operophtera brumata]